jgi:hypothetical protein
MYIGSGRGPIAERMKERQGWLIAGATSAAVLMAIRYQALSSTIRFALATGAFAAVALAIWQFNRGPLKKNDT